VFGETQSFFLSPGDPGDLELYPAGGGRPEDYAEDFRLLALARSASVVGVPPRALQRSPCYSSPGKAVAGLADYRLVAPATPRNTKLLTHDISHDIMKGRREVCRLYQILRLYGGIWVYLEKPWLTIWAFPFIRYTAGKKEELIPVPWRAENWPFFYIIREHLLSERLVDCPGFSREISLLFLLKETFRDITPQRTSKMTCNS